MLVASPSRCSPPDWSRWLTPGVAGPMLAQRAAQHRPEVRLNENFEQARALFVQGVEDFEAGRFDAAEGKFQASLVLVPGRVSTLTNLAATLIKLARSESALGILDQALACAPDDRDAWWQRGIALGDLGRHAEALAAFDHFLGLQPDHGEGWLRHGQTLQHLDRHAHALTSFDKALAIEPSLAPAWTSRGNLLKDLKRLDEAAISFERAIAHGGDAELNRYFLAAVIGQNAPASAPARYVRSLFDAYAQTFDAHLVQVLHYQAHAVLVQNLIGLGGRRYAHALDLGCGTGLCGPLVRPIVAQVDGVDLSPKMVEKARALKVYERLVPSDIEDYLRTTELRYDLILAADVFIYIGDLEPVFSAVAKVMDRGGVFCFSVEIPDSSQDIELKTSLRYGHSEPYVRDLASQHGFEIIKILRHPIREDQQQPIDGLYVYLSRD